MEITDKKFEDKNFEDFLKEAVEEFKDTEESLVKEVSAIGNSGHILVPKEHIGKHARVMIFKNKRKNWTTFKLHNSKKEEGDKKD